jgi:hypothetical protein
MRGCFTLVGLVLLLIGIASVAILIKIGGQSDGPGALVFYIGAAGGLFGGLVVLSSLRSRE